MKKNLISKMLENRQVYTDSLFQRPESFSDLLPYDEYYEKDGVFVLTDGSLGVIYELDLAQHEPMGEKEILRTVESFKPWLNLPHNCTLQFIFEQAKVAERDGEIAKLENTFPNAHPVSRFLFEKKIRALKSKCSADSNDQIFRRTGLIALRYFPLDAKRSEILESLQHPAKTLHSEMKSFVEELRTLRSITKDLESQAKIPVSRIDGKKLTEYLRRFFNPVTNYKRSFASYNPKLNLSKQIIYNSPKLDYQGIERESVRTRTLSLLTAPQIAYPGGMAYFTRLSFPYRISLNFSFPKKGEVKRFFDFKEFFLQNTPSARARVQREEILEVQEKLAREDRCLHMNFAVTVEGESDEELDDRVRSVCNLFNNELDCEAIKEDHIGLACCINSLPLCYSPDSDQSTRRFVRILRSDALNFLPIFDSCRGTKDALTFHYSREGNLAPFTLLNNPINSHTAVLADSGSGKSAFVIDCIQSAKMLSPEPLIFIIDKKSSYKAIAKYFDADITVFDRNEDIPFTPFRGIFDEEKTAFLTNLLMSAITLTSPSFVFESEHQSAISKALKLAYEKKCQRAGLVYEDGELVQGDVNDEVEITMDEFIAELSSLNDGSKSIRDVVELLLAKLKPFFGDGVYTKFFAPSKSTEKKSSLLYIYDLDALDSDPVLQTLMTMAVVAEIRRIISLPENRGRTGFVVFEEFAMLGRNNKVFEAFALDFAETMRKRGMSLITLTPRPQNYFELTIGQAFWSVAENFIFLQMNPDNVDYVTKHSKILDAATSEIAKSLRTVKDSHADFMLINKSKTIKQVYRFKQTPYDRWMSPTNAKDDKMADDVSQKFSDKWKALVHLVTYHS